MKDRKIAHIYLLFGVLLLAAFGGLTALLEDCARLGIQVPDDLAVVGFDGIETGIKPTCVLTTIRAPWEKVAEKAVDLLMALIEGEDVPPETTFPVELIVGHTT